MSRSNPTRDIAVRRPWLLRGIVVVCSLLVIILLVEGALLVPESDFEYTQGQLLDEALGVAHDELIMLIISLIVIIMIAINFRLLRRIPNCFLLICSFVLVTFSATFTVAEGLVFPEVLNYLEHLSFMAATILFAVWCWCVFGSKKRGAT